MIGHEPSHGNLIPEFERIVREAEPLFWLAENVPAAPIPTGAIWNEICDAWEFGSRQTRKRRFSSNLPLVLERVPPEVRYPDPFPTVLASEHKYSTHSKDRRRAGRKVGRKLSLPEINALMGLPTDFSTPALTQPFAYAVRGNGVPLEMGTALARAVNAYLDTHNP